MMNNFCKLPRGAILQLRIKCASWNQKFLSITNGTAKLTLWLIVRFALVIRKEKRRICSLLIFLNFNIEFKFKYLDWRWVLTEIKFPLMYNWDKVDWEIRFFVYLLEIQLVGNTNFEQWETHNWYYYKRGDFAIDRFKRDNSGFSLESISVNLLRVTRQSVQDPSRFLSFPFVLAGHASFCMRKVHTYMTAVGCALKWGR